ncbi:MAG: sigma-70 family RNA polymerase sigma factor [Lentisphaeraceae bacterium]|nr:sigma-70 family RNA polymerase sigma factor [Lentisphaeraceae bacterium]
MDNVAIQESFCSTRHTLLLKVRNQQDESSWEEFVYYYKGFIYIVCRKMGLTHHDCEETVQDVLLKLWRKLPEFEYSQEKRFRGWLVCLTSNAVRDLYRSTKRQLTKVDKLQNSPLWHMSKKPLSEIEQLTEMEWQKHISSLAMRQVKKSFSDKVISIFEDLNSSISATDLSERHSLPKNTIYKHSQRVKSALHAEIRRLHNELS